METFTLTVLSLWMWAMFSHLLNGTSALLWRGIWCWRGSFVLPAQGLELGTRRFSTQPSTDWAITAPLRHIQQSKSQQKTMVLEGLKAGDPVSGYSWILGYAWGLCFWAGHISVEKKIPGKNRPPQLTRLPPHPQARSKGTATNLPEKEFLPFFSMFLNEALTLLCFHRPAKIHQCWGGGGWGARLGRDDRIHARTLCFLLALEDKSSGF